MNGNIRNEFLVRVRWGGRRQGSQVLTSIYIYLLIYNGIIKVNYVNFV